MKQSQFSQEQIIAILISQRRACLLVDLARSSLHYQNRPDKNADLVAESRVVCEGYRREYNEERPHQSLGYLTPAEFKAKWLQEQSQTTGD